MYGTEIEVKMRELPDDLRREVLDYIEFISMKYKGKITKSKK
ncbi:MAG: DUF2281 domain-containing protein, partial [Methanosarcinales archaeon]|nr:DUF2281 domain-containing protein [Methanosarcinales archaeon]